MSPHPTRPKISQARLRCLTREGIEKLTGRRLALPLSDELARTNARTLQAKLRGSGWGVRS